MSEQHTDEEAERKLREELLSALNHDLRSPLGAIGIFCEILQLNQAALDDNQKQSLAMIQEANAKALRILDDAAELNSIYKGRVELRLAPVEIAPLVEQSAAALEEMCQPKGISVTAHGRASRDAVVDSEKLQQILLRLGEEALSYVSRGAGINFQTSDGLNGPEVLITTSGPAAEAKASARRPTAGSAKGRLGVRKPAESRYSLAGCERLARLMGGELELNDDPSFSATLRLPASSA
jgi:K+-sensing histidine kinase KdpD